MLNYIELKQRWGNRCAQLAAAWLRDGVGDCAKKLDRIPIFKTCGLKFPLVHLDQDVLPIPHVREHQSGRGRLIHF